MKFSYNWLQSFFSASAKGYCGPAEAFSEGGNKKLPKPEKLAELLTMHFAEVEEIHPVKFASRVFNKVKKEGDDYILDIDVRPNRAGDCFSHLGIAREISAVTNYELKRITNNQLKEDKSLKAKDFLSVEVKDKKACPRYTAGVICDVKVGFSPKWMRERLTVCGLRPINNVVDIANYVMLETGQPLHAFDFDKIANLHEFGHEFKRMKKLIVRFAKKGEKIITLDDEKYDLDKNILVIADAKKPVAIAGIKGGKDTEIDLKTKVIVLESANFNSRVIRRGSKSIDLKTEASWRFEHNLDPNLTELAINRAAFLIQEIAGGRVVKELIDVYPKKILPKQIRLNLDYVESLLGIKILEKEIKSILKRLSFKTVEVRPRQLLVEVPTFRLDVSLPEDLIEEIGRIYGYQKIPARFPFAALQPPKRNLDVFWEDITKDILKEVGFSEVYNYSFISDKDKEIFNYRSTELVEIENPISFDFKYLRPSLIPHLLKNVERNQPLTKFGRRAEIKIFELGKIFYKEQRTKNKEQIREKRMLTGTIMGEAFFEVKGVIDLLLNKMGISNVWYDDYQPTPEESKISIWQPKKCAEIKVDNEEIGFLGEVSSRVLENLKIESKMTVFDIDFEKLSQLVSEEQEYQPISKYPAAVRDLAILVPQQTKMEEVLNKIETAGGFLIRDIDFFDIYEGEELPEGKKNLAFHIIYQAENKTLSSEEIDKIQNKIIKILEEEPEWQIRK